MPLGVCEEVWPIIGELGDIADLEKNLRETEKGTRKQRMQYHVDRMKLMRTLFSLALKPHFPEITSEFIRDHMTALEAHEMPAIYTNLMRISGLLGPGEMKPLLDPTPPVEERSSTEISVPSSQSAPVEEYVEETGTESLAA